MEPILYHFTVPGDDFTRAGEASSAIKGALKKIGVDPGTIRRVAIAMYEAEINMVIHAGGGEIEVSILPDVIEMVMADHGPGIPDVDKAMEEGYSTASESIRSLGFGAGMGLPNIKKYTDEMKLETQVGVGTTLRLKVYLTPRS